MKRLFTFGCSFTGYSYPTWADILITEFEERGGIGYNWGRCGAGNYYIAQRIWEANAKYKFTSEDCIMVCWSGFNREDRYIHGKGWTTPGNMYSQDIYNEYFIKNYHDVRHCAMRDCMLITSTRLALTALNVDHCHWTMAPVEQFDQWQVFQTFPEQADILKTYNLKFDAMPMMEAIGTMVQNTSTAESRPQVKYSHTKPHAEWHPTPGEHLTYIQDHLLKKVKWLDTLSSNTVLFANEWENKLRNWEGPINLEETGWQIKDPDSKLAWGG